MVFAHHWIDISGEKSYDWWVCRLQDYSVSPIPSPFPLDYGLDYGSNHADDGGYFVEQFEHPVVNADLIEREVGDKIRQDMGGHDKVQFAIVPSHQILNKVKSRNAEVFLGFIMLIMITQS